METINKAYKRFSEKQKCYLEEKFSIGQETGHKFDAAAVAHDMRFARNKSGNRRFTVDDFLTTQQVQPYFSRAAAKLKNTQEETPEEDITAAKDEVAYSLTRQTMYMHDCTLDPFSTCISAHGAPCLNLI